MYELYIAKRLREEMKLAAEAENLLQRSVHLQACRYYRDLLSVPTPAELSVDEPGREASEWPLQQPQSGN
jgi:hypothetical protein